MQLESTIRELTRDLESKAEELKWLSMTKDSIERDKQELVDRMMD